MEGVVTTQTDRCRSCDSTPLVPFLDLGEQPLANALVPAHRAGESQHRYPLVVAFCEDCSLVQITVSVPPEEMFSDYPYFSSFSSGVVDNARDIAKRLIRERNLGPGNLAMEIASNDGYLLRNYLDAGVDVLGIDPAKNVAIVAEENGVPTIVDFFGVEVAERIRAVGRLADVIHANNVMAHVPDINGVVRGIEIVLSDTGIAVIETPYVKDLVDGLEFDTVYHEHLFYYSLTSFQRLLERNGLTAVDVERIPIHGGTLRVTAARPGTAASPAVQTMLEQEQDTVARVDYYRDFATRVEKLGGALRALLSDVRSKGQTVAAYGAAAKGSTLLNAFGIGADTLDFVADVSPHKQGFLMPGVHVPIVAAEELPQRRPDYTLLLAWNHAEEIMNQQPEYRALGGRFILPVPEPKVV